MLEIQPRSSWYALFSEAEPREESFHTSLNEGIEQLLPLSKSS